MLSLFQRSLSELTVADIDELIEQGVSEGQYLDFKERPSAPGGTAVGAGDWLSKDSKRELAKHMVAFANADGGWLVLGVAETSHVPPRASQKAPIVNCHDVAQRLQRALSDTIDPPPIGLATRGISVSEDGAGVIVARVPASVDAPHAVMQSQGRLAAYVRRGDQSRQMTMRDIQSMTLDVARGLERVEQILQTRREAFNQFDVMGAAVPVIGYRITIVPLRARYEVRDLYKRLDLINWKSRWYARDQSNRRYEFPALSGGHDVPRPTLRGVRSCSVYEQRACQFEVSEIGLVDIGAFHTHNPKRLNIGWIVADLMSGLRIAAKVRSEAGAGAAELLVEIEIVRRREGAIDPKTSIAEDVRLEALESEGGISRDTGAIKLPFTLPPYRVGGIEDFGQLANQVLGDLYNKIGWPASIELIFEED